MGLFGKKKNNETPLTVELNNLLHIALDFDQNTGTWSILPEGVPTEQQEQVIGARKIILELIRQLKEARVYSNGEVTKFAKKNYPWINKENIQQLISLGKYL